MRDQKLYLLNVFREKPNYPDLKRALMRQAERFKPDLILVEDKVSGMALLQELAQEGVRGLKACKPEGDKKSRLFTSITWIEDGNVLLPRDAPWLAEYRRELEGFPHAKHDDQVDSTSQVLARAQSNQWQRGHGLIFGGAPRISSQIERSFMGAFWGQDVRNR